MHTSFASTASYNVSTKQDNSSLVIPRNIDQTVTGSRISRLSPQPTCSLSAEFNSTRDLQNVAGQQRSTVTAIVTNYDVKFCNATFRHAVVNGSSVSKTDNNLCICVCTVLRHPRPVQGVPLCLLFDMRLLLQSDVVQRCRVCSEVRCLSSTQLLLFLPKLEFASLIVDSLN